MPIEQGILEYVQGNPEDAELDLSAIECTEEDYLQLAHALADNTHLRRILWKQVPPVDNQAVDRIYQLLRRNQHVDVMNTASHLPNHHLDTPLPSQLAMSIRKNKQLEQSSLLSNPISFSTLPKFSFFSQEKPLPLALPIEADHDWELDTPHDNSCLFWAAVMCYLLPVREDTEAFKQRFSQLFGDAELEHAQALRQHLKNYQPFSREDTTFQDETFQRLVREVFRSRVVGYIADRREAFEPYLEDNRRWVDYLALMHRENSWGGQLEIRAISDMLTCSIQVAGRTLTDYGQDYHTLAPLSLVHVEGSHYHYRLDKRHISNSQLPISSTGQPLKPRNKTDMINDVEDIALSLQQPNVPSQIIVKTKSVPKTTLNLQPQEKNAQNRANTLTTRGYDLQYFYNLQDMQILLQALRQEKLMYQQTDETSYACKPGEEFNAIRENQQGIWLTAPYNADTFSESFLNDVKTITGKHTIDNDGNTLEAKNNRWQAMPKLVIIPLLSDNHWRALRIEIDYGIPQMSVLWDDPYGKNHFSNKLRQKLLPCLKQAVSVFIQVQTGFKEFKLSRKLLKEYEKNIDQQGWQEMSVILLRPEKNNWDCGPIIISNCLDYCQPELLNVDFVNKSAYYYTIQAAKTSTHPEQIFHLRQQHKQQHEQIMNNLPDIPERLPSILHIEFNQILTYSYKKPLEQIKTELELKKNCGELVEEFNELIERGRNTFIKVITLPAKEVNCFLTRIYCDNALHAYYRKDYLTAYKEADRVLNLCANAKWLKYDKDEYNLLPKDIKKSFEEAEWYQITDRSLAYFIILNSCYDQKKVTVYLKKFANETFQSIDPIAYQLLAKLYQALGQVEQIAEVILYSQWIKQELELSSMIRAIQESLEKIELQDGLSNISMKQTASKNYNQLALSFEALGDIYLKKKSYPKAAGLYNMAVRISEDKLESSNDGQYEKLVTVEQALMRDFLGEKALFLSLNVWQVQQANYHQQLTIIRNQARQSLKEGLTGLSEKPEEDQVEKTKAIQAIFIKIAQGMQGLIQCMLQDCYAVLGQPPCRYAILGLGSLARQEMTPYSDLEWAILIEDTVETLRQLGNDNYEELGLHYNEQYKIYFRHLADLLYVKVTCLGETILPSLAIESLNPEFTDIGWTFFDTLTPRGFAMDGAMSQACKVPQGKKDKEGNVIFELIGTPTELASYIGQKKNANYWVDEEPHLPLVLSNTSLIEGDCTLLADYWYVVRNKLHEIHQATQQPVFQYITQKLIGKTLDVKGFNPFLNEPGELFDAKKSFYRIPNLFIDELAIYYGIDFSYVSGFDKLTQLEIKGILSAEAKQNLAYMLSETMRFRLQTYLHYNKQQEQMNPLLYYFSTEYISTNQFSIQATDILCLKYMLHVLISLYDIMEEFNSDPAIGEQELKNTTLYDNESFSQGLIANRLYQYPESIVYYKQAITDIETHFKNNSNIELNIAALYSNIGASCRKLGDNHQALVYHQRALSIHQEFSGEQHPNVAALYDNIAGVYHELGDIQQALIYQQKALTIFNFLYKEEHPDVAKSYNNIGLIYRSLGNTQQALIYYLKALVIVRKIYSDKHIHIAALYNNIAKIYHDIGDIQQALTYYQKAQAIYQNLFGELHPYIANCYSGIGAIHKDMGEFQQALFCYKRALSIYQKFFAVKHPDVATSYDDIAEVYRDLGDMPQALIYNRKALAIYKELFNKPHLDIAKSYNNIGLTYHAIGEEKQALYYYLKALAAYQTLPGKQDSGIALCYHNIGRCYFNLVGAKQALNYYKKSLQIYYKIFREEHPDIAMCYNSLGEVYRTLEMPKKALKYHQKAWAIYYKLFGNYHPHIATVYNNVGVDYICIEDFKEALAYHQEALLIYQKYFNGHHPSLGNAYSNIGLCYDELGDGQSALQYHQKALAMYQKFFNNYHPDIAISYHNIGLAYHDIGLTSHKIDLIEEALKYYKKAVTIWQKLYGEYPQQSKIQNLQMDFMEEATKPKSGLFKRECLDIRTPQGDQHSKIAALYNSIGLTYSDLGNIEQALAYHWKALTISQKLYGENHTQVATSYNNIAKVFRMMGDIQLALNCYQKSLAIYYIVYGEKHSNVAMSYNNLAVIYFSLRNTKKALEYTLKSHKILQQLYDKTHPKLLKLVSNIEKLNDILKMESEQINVSHKTPERKSISEDIFLCSSESINPQKVNSLVKKYELQDNSQPKLEKGLRKAAANQQPVDLKQFIMLVTNINAQDDNPSSKRTALHWAVIKQNEKCIIALLDAGARLDIQDAMGKTAWDYAADNEKIKLLLSLYKFNQHSTKDSKDYHVNQYLLPISKTKGGGDCAFHASLGEWDEDEHQFVCQNVLAQREKMQKAILTHIHQSNCPILHSVCEAIQEAVRNAAEKNKVFKNSPQLNQLVKVYNEFKAQQHNAIELAWQQLEANEALRHYVDQHGSDKKENKTIKDRYVVCLNNDKQAFEELISQWGLQETYEHYNRLQANPFDWDNRITAAIIKAYVDAFIAKPGEWLLPGELNVIAHVFGITIEYYTAINSQKQVFNPGQTKTIAVVFNGVNHFERAQSSEKIANCYPLGTNNYPKNKNQALPTRQGLFSKKRSQDEKAQETLHTLLPPDFRIGKALDTNDCFFDAFAQAYAVEYDKPNTSAKAMRLLCDSYAKTLDKQTENWIKALLNSDTTNTVTYKDYLATIQYTQAEMDELKKDHLFSGLAIQGQSHLDGRLLCETLDVKLHVIEILENEETHEIIINHQFIDKTGSTSVEVVSYTDKTIVHLVIYHGHFVPLMPMQDLGQENKVNPDLSKNEKIQYYSQQRQGYTTFKPEKFHSTQLTIDSKKAGNMEETIETAEIEAQRVYQAK